MSKLAPLVGKDITIKCYLERFCHLCHDKLFQVRKVCASSIGEMASVVGSHITENVLVRKLIVFFYFLYLLQCCKYVCAFAGESFPVFVSR